MRRVLCVLLAMLALLPGCERVESQPAEGAWYLRDTPNGPVWEQAGFTPASEDPAEQCAEVLAALQAPPEGLRAALPAEVQVLSIRVVSNVTYVNFSSEYAALSPGDRSIACAAVVHSLLQLKGLHYVSVSAEGKAQSPTYERYCTLGTFILE
ncbi:MAG: GerMN domain-containing protein [Clostridiaceae bacterium]|nr:GerMN domain-containing protein [Clostridiaceae bacterium]